MKNPASRRQPATPLEVALEATALLNEAEAELVRLRSHIATLAAGDVPGDAFAASRSARIVSATAGQVADQLRDLAARQSLVV